MWSVFVVQQSCMFHAMFVVCKLPNRGCTSADCAKHLILQVITFTQLVQAQCLFCNPLCVVDNSSIQFTYPHPVFCLFITVAQAYFSLKGKPKVADKIVNNPILHLFICSFDICKSSSHFYCPSQPHFTPCLFAKFVT